jgi:hypothetical protein
MRVYAIILAFTLAGCKPPQPTPLSAMIDAASTGERVCVRNDVLVKGKACHGRL